MVEAAKAAPADADGGSEEALRFREAELTGRIANARRILAAVDAYHAAVEATAKAVAKAKAHREAEKRFAAMEEALADSGFLAKKVEEPLGLLREKVRVLGEAFFREPTPIEVRNDLTVWIHGRPVETGSRGQQWLVGAVMAAAFVSLSGFGILVLDDLNMVGSRARDRVLGSLMRMARAAEIQQVFVACVRGRDGWCDACGSMSVGDSNGGCVLVRGGQKCGSPVGPSRPRGNAAAVLRTFEVVAGTATEVMPLGNVVATS
jgi:hypothetical protein